MFMKDCLHEKEDAMQTQELQQTVDYLKQHHLKVVTAESCTAGLIASALAELPGSGEWLECAFVTYSEDAKVDCLNVSQDLIDRYGLTSVEVAEAMASGALCAARANLGIATTGVAGPSAGDGDVPVGNVCIAWAFKFADGMRKFSEQTLFTGDRNDIRQAALCYALKRIAHYHGQIAEQDAA
jgi:nicotinamide-nucleotide amidase